jgi:fructosamine-3-kinase
VGDLRDHVACALDADVSGLAPLGGGDVADAFRVKLADGRSVFAKTHPQAPPGFFSTEAAGLAWLRAAEAVAIPEVLAVSDDPPLLVLEWIEPGRPGRTTEAELGRALAALHAAGAPCFGREDRRTTGSRGLPNEPCASWAESYARNRLLPMARLARDGSALPTATIRQLEAVAARLPQLGGPEEPPARLHGDLWGGNRLVGAGGVSWLIDPAAHGGHREFDLAMMRLFGGFGEACFAAYAAVAPLAPDWEHRVPLHQLAPLVVHAIKFGGGYVGATARALEPLT